MFKRRKAIAGFMAAIKSEPIDTCVIYEWDHNNYIVFLSYIDRETMKGTKLTCACRECMDMLNFPLTKREHTKLLKLANKRVKEI